LAFRDVTDEFDLDMCGESQTLSLRNRSKLVDWHVIKLGIVLDSGQFPKERLTRVIVLSQVMPMPNASSLLEIDRRHLVIAVRLGLLQIGFLNKFFDEKEKHARIA